MNKKLNRLKRILFVWNRKLLQGPMNCAICNHPIMITFHTDDPVGLGGAHVECVEKQQNQKIITPGHVSDLSSRLRNR